MRLRCATFAEVNNCAAPFGHAATHAPHPMHAAASNAASATTFGTGVRLASAAPPVGPAGGLPPGAAPLFPVIYPPASTMRSNAERFTTRSRTTGNAEARH